MWSNHSGLVDFPAGQVTFHSHLPDGQEPREVVSQLNPKKVSFKPCPGQAIFEGRTACLKGKLEFMFFSKPCHLANFIQLRNWGGGLGTAGDIN